MAHPLLKLKCSILLVMYSWLNGFCYEMNDEYSTYTQFARSTGANVSVMVLQGCKCTPQKGRPIESGHGRHAVQVANECSYKLGQK